VNPRKAEKALAEFVTHRNDRGELDIDTDVTPKAMYPDGLVKD
jgi:hypothetical protein